MSGGTKTTHHQQQQHHHNNNQGGKSTQPAQIELDLDALLQNDNGRKLFALYLKELNNSVDNLLTLYLICCCFQNQRIEDRTRIKQILEKTYQACFVKSQLPYLNADLKQKLCDTLRRSTYNESIFNAVKKDIKHILETNYYPAFLKSKVYLDNFQKTTATPLGSQASQSSSSMLENIMRPFGASTSKSSNKSLNRSVQASTRLTANESTLSLKVPAMTSGNESFQMPGNPYSVLTKPIPVSCQDSEIQSVLSEDDYHHYHHGSSSRHLNNRKLDKNIKQSLAANKNVKLNLPDVSCNASSSSFAHEQWTDVSVNQTNNNNHHGSKKVPIPLSESDPKKFFELVTSKLDKFLQQEPHRSRARQSMSTTHLDDNERTTAAYTTIEDDMNNLNFIDSHIDEHINHISKNVPARSGVYPMDAAGAHYAMDPTALVKPPNHHFYQLTSKSKEVDIDSQKMSSFAADSGHMSTATKSIDSIERVNDWLTSNTKSNHNHHQHQHHPQPPPPQQQSSFPVEPMKNTQTSSEKITVAYYLPGEELAYISTFAGKYLSLAQFKQLITKKGNFRYFFKTKSDLLDEECIVYQEATDESSLVPMFNGKVIAKIEKI